jgi:hypothetical protein
MDRGLLYGIIFIVASLYVLYLCIVEIMEEHDKFDWNDYSQSSIFKGIIGSLLLFVCGIIKILESFSS